MNGPKSLPIRSVGEWRFTSSKIYYSPFADVEVTGHFTSPQGTVKTMPAFYDGDGTWKLRFNPKEEGDWKIKIISRPYNPDFDLSAEFSATGSNARGTLVLVPEKHWGFEFENGEPFFPFGDTVYDLFGMEFCGGNTRDFIARRVQQGFNLFRCRFNVSYFHPPAGDFSWQTKRMWSWGGSATSPRFDLFNLDWFRSIDGTIAHLETTDIGLELIMEGWGFEFPFNSRMWFTPEWEQLYMRYLIARYDAYNCTYFWTPLNEYEYYPNGDWNWRPEADRWQIRIGRWIKETAPHNHLVSSHNGPWVPRFAERFRADPEAVDNMMFQHWGTRGKEDAWIAAGIEDVIKDSFTGWTRGKIFAEWGYERNPDFENKLPHHEFCDRNHTRRSAWRGISQAMGIINGQENSWGPWMLLDEDQPGTADLVILKEFLTREVNFATLRPLADLVTGAFASGERPLALHDDQNKVSVIYFPVGGSAVINLSGSAQWFDPRTGSLEPASNDNGRFTAPAGVDDQGHPLDFVLLVRGSGFTRQT